MALLFASVIFFVYLCTRNVLAGDCGRVLMPAAHPPQQSITFT